MTGVGATLYTPPAPYWRSRPVINKVRPIIRREISKLTSQKPSATIIPASSEEHDIFAAEAGEQIWNSTYRDSDIESAIARAVWWNQVTGTGFIKCTWDPEAIDYASGQAGNICYAPETPFHIFVPDFREEDLEKQPFLIHAQTKSVDWVKINYPDAKLQSSSDKQNELLDDQWLNLIGIQDSKNAKSILVLECWIKPQMVALFPEGAMFTVVGDTLVQGGMGYPYSHHKFPFSKLTHIPTGKFYGESTIVDIISLQREYNRTRGQVIEIKNRLSKPQFLAEKGAIEAQKVTSEPGQIIEYETGYAPPTYLVPPPIPSYIADELARIIEDMNDISGQHEVSKGTVPPGVTAATAISFLQEQDDSMLAPTYRSIEKAVEKVAYMTLCYVQEYWMADRIVRMVGSDGSFSAMAFKGSDLKGNTDIRIEAGSALPTSKAAKQAFIMDLMKMGFVDPSIGLEVMEMGGIAKVYEAVQVDVRQAQRENLRMMQITPEILEQHAMAAAMGDPEAEGLPIPVNTWDNHALHIEVHNRERKGQTFESASPEVKALFEQHVQMHVMAVLGGRMQMDPAEMIKEDIPFGPQEEDPESEGGSPGPDPGPSSGTEPGEVETEVP